MHSAILQHDHHRIDLVPVNHVYNMQQWLKRKTAAQQPGEAEEKEQQSASDRYAMKQRQLIIHSGVRRERVSSHLKNPIVLSYSKRSQTHSMSALASNQPKQDEVRWQDDAEVMKATKTLVVASIRLCHG